MKNRFDKLSWLGVAGGVVTIVGAVINVFLWVTAGMPIGLRVAFASAALGSTIYLLMFASLLNAAGRADKNSALSVALNKEIFRLQFFEVSTSNPEVALEYIKRVQSRARSLPDDDIRRKALEELGIDEDS